MYEPIPKPEGVTFSDQSWSAAVSAVRGYCGWHVAPSTTETVTVDGSGGNVQFLPTLRLTEVHSVVADGRTVPDPEWSSFGMLRGVRSCKFRGVVATITHGYDDLPADVLEVATDMASMEGRTGASGFISGPHQVQFGQTSSGAQAGTVGLSDLQKEILDRYALGSRP